jgi:hypothetical protein
MKIFRYRVTVNDTVRILSVGVQLRHKLMGGFKFTRYEIVHSILAAEDDGKFDTGREKCILDGRLSKFEMSEDRSNAPTIPTIYNNSKLYEIFANAYAKKVGIKLISKLKGSRGHNIQLEEVKLADIVPQEIIIGGSSIRGGNTIAIGNKDNPNPLG